MTTTRNHGNVWVSIPVARPAARMRLFCLPYAGGGASEFVEWAHLLPATVEVVPVQLPGRNRRIHEPPRTSMGRLVPEIADGLAAYLDRPFGLFGYSMGAWVAFELARELRRRGGPRPEALIVAAAGPPDVPSPIAYHDASNEDLIEWMRRLGGSEALLREPALLPLILPRVRADLQVTGTYRAASEPPLPHPVFVYVGSADDEARPEQAGLWCRHAGAGFRTRVLTGGHFFLHDRRDELLGHLIDDLEV